jgi:hypothetical protein
MTNETTSFELLCFVPILRFFISYDYDVDNRACFQDSTGFPIRHNIQTPSGAYPASYSIIGDSLLGSNAAEILVLTSTPLYPFMALRLDTSFYIWLTNYLL